MAYDLRIDLLLLVNWQDVIDGSDGKTDDSGLKRSWVQTTFEARNREIVFSRLWLIALEPMRSTSN